MFLEASIKFWEDEVTEEGKDIRKKQDIHVLCHCVCYTDAESMATEYGLDITSESFDVGPITELQIDDYYPDEEHNGYPWFKCKAEYLVLTDKGKKKKYKRSILVQALDSAAASVRSTEIMVKWADTKDCKTVTVSETKIMEILRVDKKK